MQKVGLGLDYSNLCKGYNTVYLDRDNDDRETIACMDTVMKWFKVFLSEFLERFESEVYRMNQASAVGLGEIVQRRFFFYSLEKEMILQTFILQQEDYLYDSWNEWLEAGQNTLLIKNDDEGEGVYFYCEKDSEIHRWLLDRLAGYSLDEIL